MNELELREYCAERGDSIYVRVRNGYDDSKYPSFTRVAFCDLSEEEQERNIALWLLTGTVPQVSLL